MIKAVCFFTILILASLGVNSETIDFRYNSNYCKEHYNKEEAAKFNNYFDKCISVDPTKIINGKKIQSIETLVNGLNTALLIKFSHELNQHYINKMSSSFFQRLISAQRINPNLPQMNFLMDTFKKKCQNDNYPYSTKTISLAFDDGKNEYKNFKMSPMDNIEFIKKNVVAVFELDRLERVNEKILNYKEKNLKNISEDQRNQLDLVYSSNLKRIIRIQYNYPVLGIAHFDFSSRKFLNLSKELYGRDKENFLNNNRIFYGDSNLEKVIDLIPTGQDLQELPIPFFMKNESTEDRYQKYYENLYKKILNPKYKVPNDIITFIKKASNESINQYFLSLIRKCENNNPCRALATDPSYAAYKMDKINLTENLGPLACLCQIEYNQESVNGKQNLMLGFGSLGGILFAVLFPESLPIVWAAYGVNGVGMLTSAMGIYDGIVNENSAKENAINRSGGAVLESDLLNTLNSEYQAKFEKNYNNITGIIGMIPPGKIIAPAGHLLAAEIMKTKAFIARTAKETVFATTVAPAPNLKKSSYADEWNPHKVYAPISTEFRNKFPELSKNLDLSMSNKAISSHQDKMNIVLNELKKAASEMLSQKDDQAYLEKGIILKKYLPDNLKNLNLPFIQ